MWDQKKAGLAIFGGFRYQGGVASHWSKPESFFLFVIVRTVWKCIGMLLNKWCILYILCIRLCSFLVWSAFSHVSYWYCRMHFDWARCKATSAVLFSECTVSGGVCTGDAAYNVLAVCHFMWLFFYSPTKEPCIWLPNLSFFIPRTISGCQLKLWVDMIKYMGNIKFLILLSFPANPRLAGTFASDLTFRRNKHSWFLHK